MQGVNKYIIIIICSIYFEFVGGLRKSATTSSMLNSFSTDKVGLLSPGTTTKLKYKSLSRPVGGGGGGGVLSLLL